ncbi:MAG: hypothetical protein ACLSA6_17305 [Holdemania massiliensis]
MNAKPQTIFYTSTQDLSQGFTRRYDDLFIYNRKYIEGPFTLPSLHEPGVYYLYVDNYPNQCFYVARFSPAWRNRRLSVACRGNTRRMKMSGMVPRSRLPRKNSIASCRHTTDLE